MVIWLISVGLRFRVKQQRLTPGQACVVAAGHNAIAEM